MLFFGLISDVFLGKVKTILTIVSTIIAILLSIYGFAVKAMNDKLTVENNNLVDYNSVLTTENVTYQNDLGQTVTKTIQYQRHINDLENSKDSLEVQIYRAVKASNLKDKQLKEAYAINVSSTGGGQFGVSEEMTMILTDSMGSQQLDTIEIKTFNDGFLDAKIYPDSLTYTYDEDLTLIKAERLEERKFFLWRWVGWKKKMNRDMVEVVSSNPNSSQKVRMIKLEDSE